MNKITICILVLFALVSAQNYDPDLSKTFLYYSKASYCDKKQIANWDCAACPYNSKTTDVKVETSLVHGTQGFVGYNYEMNLIIFAFRGSQNIQNWIDNLDYKKTDYSACSGCQIHKGFNKAWESVEKGMMKQLKNLQAKYPKAGVAVTGHSLGGAIAELAALSIVQNGYTLRFLYTFGTPRVGNEQFAQYAHSIIPDAMRVVHYKDPVPHVPLQKMGFLQVPTEVWYDSSTDVDSYKVCTMPGVEEDPNCSDSKLDANIGDHLQYLGISTQCNAGNSIEEFSALERFQMKRTNEHLRQVLLDDVQIVQIE